MQFVHHEAQHTSRLRQPPETDFLPASVCRGFLPDGFLASRYSDNLSGDCQDRHSTIMSLMANHFEAWLPRQFF